MDLGKIIKYCLFSVLLLTVGCKDEAFGPQAANGSAISPDSLATLIVNEGNFQWGNASVGQYNPDLDLYTEGLYRLKNGNGIGDVLQELHHINNHYYAVLNGSNLLRICASDWSVIKSISGLGAPRRLISFQKRLYLSDLYSPAILVMDLEGNPLDTIIGSKPAEQLIIWQNQLIMTQKKQIVQYNPVLDTLFSIVQFGGNLLVSQVADDRLFLAFANGDLETWSHLDSTRVLVQSFSTPILDLTADVDGNLYSYRQNVLALHASSEQFNAKAIQAIDFQNFYGLDYDSKSTNLYLFDALNFVNRSKVYRIQREDGEIISEFEVGAIANGLVK